MSAKKSTQKSEGFTDEERAAMKERARELKAEARANKKKAEKAEGDRRDAGTGSHHGRAAP
jgi:hypothetical protein